MTPNSVTPKGVIRILDIALGCLLLAAIAWFHESAVRYMAVVECQLATMRWNSAVDQRRVRNMDARVAAYHGERRRQNGKR